MDACLIRHRRLCHVDQSGVCLSSIRGWKQQDGREVLVRSPATDIITPTDARTVLWCVYGVKFPGISDPSQFIQHIIAAMTQAREDDLNKLALGFPGLLAAFRLSQKPNGKNALFRYIPIQSA